MYVETSIENISGSFNHFRHDNDTTQLYENIRNKKKRLEISKWNFCYCQVFYQENQKLEEKKKKEQDDHEWRYLIKYLTKLICIDFFPFPFWNGRKWKSWYMLKTRKLTWLYLQQSVYKEKHLNYNEMLKLKSFFDHDWFKDASFIFHFSLHWEQVKEYFQE